MSAIPIQEVMPRKFQIVSFVFIFVSSSRCQSFSNEILNTKDDDEFDFDADDVDLRCLATNQNIVFHKIVSQVHSF